MRLRQQQATADAKIRDLTGRLENTEAKQQTMINMFAAAFKNPAMCVASAVTAAGRQQQQQQQQPPNHTSSGGGGWQGRGCQGGVEPELRQALCQDWGLPQRVRLRSNAA